MPRGEAPVILGQVVEEAEVPAHELLVRRVIPRLFQSRQIRLRRHDYKHAER